MKSIKVIAFDADDTLWVNEPYFRESEADFCALLSEYMQPDDLVKELLKIERINLPSLGYGVKAFIISMIETALKVSNGNCSTELISGIIKIGKSQLGKPLILVDGIEDVLSRLQESYRLILITKGDLLEQEVKISNSGLSSYFESTEIVSEKNTSSYGKVLRKLNVSPREFVMIGNSIRSDILPVLELDAYAIHIPAEITWVHENVSETVVNGRLLKLSNVRDLLKIF